MKERKIQISETSISKNNKGVKAVLDQALQSYEKLPMLQIIFDRLVRLLTVSLRNLTSETVTTEITNFSSLRFGTFVDSIKVPANISIFKVSEWDNFGLLILDSELVFSFIDVLLGGKKNEITKDIQNKNATYIEQELIKYIVEFILHELGAAFDPITPATFNLERLENNPSFTSIARTGDAIILLQMKIEMDARGGVVSLVIPYGTIEPIKKQLQQVFIGEKLGHDIEWEESLISKIHDIDMPLEVVIINKLGKIEDIANLKIGDTIIMDHKQDEEVLVRCNRIDLFKGKVGKVEDKVAVSISATLRE